MPKPTKGPRLGGGPAHERLLLANLAAALFTHKSIKTTETKAKRLRPVAERLITFAKRGDLHARRRVLGVIGDKTVVHELFTQIAPLVAERDGGYTRITKLGFRKGDNASMVQIELVLEPVTAKPGRARATTTSAAAPVVAEPVADETDAPAIAEPSDAEPAASADADTVVVDEADTVVVNDVDTVVVTEPDTTVVSEDAAVAAPSPDAAPVVSSEDTSK